MYPGVGTFVLIRLAQTFYERIIFALGTSAVDLTGVDPNCAAVSGVSPYAGATGNEGCAYAWSVSVQVLSNRPWTGTLYGDDNNSPTSDVTVDDGSFHASTGSIASYSDCDSAQAVPEVNSPWTWESSGARGNTGATHYQCAVVDWDDADGTIDSTMQYSVSQ